MNIVVIGHYARRRRAERLAGGLSAHLIMDEVGLGALRAHRQALQWCAGQRDRCIVMEDDALPVPGFLPLAEWWLDRFPNDLFSGYLGTGRPPQWQRTIAHMLRNADEMQLSHIALPQLLHGVCYSPPAGKVAALLEAMPINRPADFAVGEAWRQVGRRPVVYPVHSLVDHDDGPSVEKHPDGQARTEVRRAWRLAGMGVGMRDCG
ncbi:MAG: hypothetical protein QM636_20340 [Rhizobium sp.]